MTRICARFGLVASVLTVLTACLEDFERLTTRVTYDPMTRTLRVERTLHNVSAKFLGCTDAATCVDAAAKMTRLDYEGDKPEMDFGSLLTASESERDAMAEQLAKSMVGSDGPTWTKLAKGLVESAAFDVQVVYRRNGDELDAVIRYGASADSKAATDTGVIIESSRKGKKTEEYLVVDGGKDVGGFSSQAPPALLDVSKYVVRTQAGATEKTWWVLPVGVDSVAFERYVDETAQPIFADIDGLDAAMKEAGLL